MVLRPGFEPGITGSKGQYACPDYTTGALRAIKRSAERLYNPCQGLRQLEAGYQSEDEAPYERRLNQYQQQGLKLLLEIAYREGK